MKIRFPKILCVLFLLLILLTSLPSCSGKEPSDPVDTTAQQGSNVANADELIGSWMRLSGDQMEIYTFRPDGKLMIYEMENATAVRSKVTGSYTLTGDRLTLAIGGDRESYTVLTGSGNALILNGEILTPVAEPAD